MLNRPFLLAGVALTALLVLCAAGIIVGGLLYTGAQSGTAAVPLPSPSGAAAQSTAPAASGVRVGAPAPDFTLPDLDGKSVRLSDLRGQVVVLNFWATWCGPCRQEMQTIDKTDAKYQGKPVTILGVNVQESPDQVRGFADLYHLSFTLLLDRDGRVSNSYRVNALPTTFFIDREGIIRNITVGGPMTDTFLERQIESLLGPSQ